MSIFKLRFPIAKVRYWGDDRCCGIDDSIPQAVGDRARTRGFLDREGFLALAHWKSPRPRKHYEKNDAARIKEVTAFAFSASSDLLRLEALTLLSGVNARTASALLLWCHADPYPIMDIRAYWSLGLNKAPHNWASTWPEYVKTCRHLSKEAGVTIHILDRALWKYSAEKNRVAE